MVFVIGVSYGVCYWCGLVVVDRAAVTLESNIIFYEIGFVGNGTPTDQTEGKSLSCCL